MKFGVPLLTEGKSWTEFPIHMESSSINEITGDGWISKDTESLFDPHWLVTSITTELVPNWLKLILLGDDSVLEEGEAV